MLPGNRHVLWQKFGHWNYGCKQLNDTENLETNPSALAQEQFYKGRPHIQLNLICKCKLGQMRDFIFWSLPSTGNKSNIQEHKEAFPLLTRLCGWIMWWPKGYSHHQHIILRCLRFRVFLRGGEVFRVGCFLFCLFGFFWFWFGALEYHSLLHWP